MTTLPRKPYLVKVSKKGKRDQKYPKIFPCGLQMTFKQKAQENYLKYKSIKSDKCMRFMRSPLYARH